MDEKPQIVIDFEGSDPQALTEAILKALEENPNNAASFWLGAKDREEFFAGWRKKVETVIEEKFGDGWKKGTNAIGDSGLKAVRGYTEEWDQEVIAKLEAEMNPDYFPFVKEVETTYSVHKERLEGLKAMMPDAYNFVCSALKLKPKKASFKFEPSKKKEEPTNGN